MIKLFPTSRKMWIVSACFGACWSVAAVALSQAVPVPSAPVQAVPSLPANPGSFGAVSVTTPAPRPARTRASARAITAAPEATQTPPSAPAAATPPDPPPPYPVAARATPAPTSDPGYSQVPAITPIIVPAPPPAKRTLLKKLVQPTSPNIAENSLNSYIERLRRETSSAQPAAGAIWNESGRLTRLTTDVRAMRPNDLIQVVVVENLAASTDGTVKNQRASAANSSISSLIGALHASNALQNLVNQSASNSLNAQGASATNSKLTTTFGGQVVEVLPNGMLVIEAARQVEFSQQTQTIILRGLVRPEDISQQNQVTSTAISSLELEVKGKGIVNDYTRRQNPLVRLLQQILIF